MEFARPGNRRRGNWQSDAAGVPKAVPAPPWSKARPAPVRRVARPLMTPCSAQQRHAATGWADLALGLAAIDQAGAAGSARRPEVGTCREDARHANQTASPGQPTARARSELQGPGTTAH